MAELQVQLKASEMNIEQRENLVMLLTPTK